MYISKEIVQRKDVGRFGLKFVENYLIGALQRPTDKIASSTSLLPTGRFFTDFILNLKFLNRIDIVGYTINPEHVRGVSWSKILSAVTNSKVILLVRTNLVKMAFSGKYVL